MFRFSVVIPTCHRNDHLAQCLAKLAPKAQTLSNDAYEVIVTDDGSESTAELLVREQFSWAKWMAGPRRGPAANRNHGAAHASGEWLAFTDDDCLPDAGWLAAYQQAISEHPGCMAFDGRVYADRPQHRFDETAPIKSVGGCLWSCNIVVNRHTFASVGGFDARFPYAAMEDVDFDVRLKTLGIQPVFVSDASICHPWRPSGDWRKLHQQLLSLFLFLTIHPDQRRYFGPLKFLKELFFGLIQDLQSAIFRFKGRGLALVLLNSRYRALALYKTFRHKITLPAR